MASGLFYERMRKPRVSGTTEMRGPSHSFLGPHLLKDVLELSGEHIDGLKFVGGSSSLMSRSLLRDAIKLAHEHDVYVSTGGWSEHLLNQGRRSFQQFVKECKGLGFDMIEFDTFNFLHKLPEDDLLLLTRTVKREGLKVKPSLYVGEEDADSLISRAERFLNAGADCIMVESDGLTDKARPWQTDVIAKLVERVGLEKLMFEAVHPDVFEWYISNYGTGVNLFVDHSHVNELQNLRHGKRGPRVGRFLL